MFSGSGAYLLAYASRGNEKQSAVREREIVCEASAILITWPQTFCAY